MQSKRECEVSGGRHPGLPSHRESGLQDPPVWRASLGAIRHAHLPLGPAALV